MPQLSRIRIVNFQYNNGKRLIPDELYDLSGSRGDACDNTLIALINGGGKSVLVQLMLQPVLPGAKVSKRRIEDFFTSASCHCFVLLEWRKDNSPEKLLTGISMAASASTADFSEERGRPIKYYTFWANYAEDSAPCSIANLPLSRNENGRFAAAEYDCIRKLKNKSGMRDLDYCPSDEKEAWKKKLEEYGIYQDEWRRIMEPLNSDEGGMSQFFTQSRFRTADRLIDGLFIPAVETRLGQSDQSADSSLATMLLNYVKRYEQQAENIRNRDRCLAFRDDLTFLQKDVQAVWTLWDSRNETLRTMFGYSAALDQAVRSMEAKKESLDQELESTDAALRHLDWEDASEHYYQCEDAERQSRAALEKAGELHEELEARQEADRRRQNVLTAARCADRRRELQGRLDGTLKSIADKTRGDDNAARLGGSVRAAVEAVLPGQREACQAAEAADLAAQQALSDADTALKAAENTERICFGKKEKADAVWTETCGRTDGMVEGLEIDAMRNLSGIYMTEELEDARKEYQTRLDAVRAELENIHQEKAETETALHRIPEELASLGVQLRDTAAAAQKNHEEMDEYREIEDGIREICRQYTLNFDARFSGSVQEYLNRRRSDQKRKIRDIERETDLTKDEFSAAEGGTVHVPRKVLDCLDDAGIPYQTCEQYLLAQNANGNLTAAACVEILEACPSAAFGILTEELSLLKEITHPQWLPASVPVFTNGEMEAVLARKAVRPDAFSRYSVQSFLDRANYVEHLRKNIENLSERKNQLRETLEHTEAQIKTAEAFTVYDADWLGRREEQAEKLDTAYKDYETRIDAMKSDETAKQNRQRELEQVRQEREQEEKSLERWLDRFTKLREELEREQAAYQVRSEAMRTHRESKDSLDNARGVQNYAKDAAAERAAERKAEQELLKEMEDAAQAVAEYEAQGAEAGDWRDLYQQYRTLLENREADIRQLKEKADSLRNDIAEAEKQLSLLGLEEREYQGVVYSQEEEYSLRIQIESRKGALKKAQTALNEQIREAAAAEAELKHAHEKLDQYGGQPLEPECIGGNRERRRRECRDKREALQGEMKKLSKCVSDYKQQSIKVGIVFDQLSEETDSPEEIAPIPLADKYQQQWTELYQKWTHQNKTLDERGEALKSKLRDLTAKFADTVQGKFLDQAMALVQNNPRGDVWFTLDQRIDDCVHATALRISQLETDLEDFDHMEWELIHQCCVQGEQVYHELKTMMNSTRVRLGGTGRLTEMIRFGLPDETDPERAEEEIALELKEGTKTLLELMADKSVSETEVRQRAEKIVSSGTLLRKYVQREQISLKAYKVDAVEGNGEYRTWEQTLVNNSGAEKFLVYFSIILALMNYTRGGDTSGIGQTAGVLILDNPFGVITSPHVLDPMFRIARRFRIQLICLSDITKCDITACFDTVIRAVVRENPLSSVSLLTHEGNEKIEHGFYRSVQLSL